MEFKNLAEVTQLDEVPEGASVLAATAEGEVVRVPGDGLGGGGDLVVFTLETNEDQITATCNVSFDKCLEIVKERGTTAAFIRTPAGIAAAVSIYLVSADGNPATSFDAVEEIAFEIPDGGMVIVYDKTGAVTIE